MGRGTTGKAAAPDSDEPRTRLLWELIRPRLPLFALATLAGLIATGARLGTPLATKHILDSVNGKATMTGPLSILVALVAVGAVAQWWQMVTLGRLSEGVVYDARRRMNLRFLYARLTPLQKSPVGELVTRVTSDSLLLRDAASSSIVGGVNGIVMLFGALVMMAILDLTLVAVTIGAVIVVVILFGLLLPAIAQSQEQAQAAVGELGAELDGSLRAIKSIKAATAEERVRSRLDEIAERSRDLNMKAVRRQALAITTSWTGVQAAVLVILAVGAVRVADGAMTVSTLVAFLLYAFQIGDPIGQLSTSLTGLQAGLAAARRIRQIDAIPSESERPTALGPQVPSMNDADHPVGDGSGMLLRGVHAAYPGGDPVLNGIDLRMPNRGHVALIGPSGAGKTTLLSLLLRFLDPDSGELRLGTTAYHEVPASSTRNHFAYVEQESPLIPGTLRENLRLINTEATDAEMYEVLDRLSLSGMVRDLPGGLDAEISSTSLSGGQRQRVAVARALLAHRPVLLLDEATAQVDALTENAIHDAIVDHARTGLVITIAHRLSTVVDADMIVVLQDGHLIAQGTHDELLDSSPLYRDLLSALRIPTESGDGSVARLTPVDVPHRLGRHRRVAHGEN
ncbi:ABC transporter ATP-binding protein [Williamsia serinedens]|uniref:ATP-binding cassette, subfamily B n=1 Tax=Williamsia serinedens TaxID=391736 RepID=A0ABT1GXY7_9NOCA|nr:ABC transporter ATP-binding protein [Williamsia serinedens]MCP2159736.1 ATP-binding cassette, subfamily B [Williamsia serinedens]